MRRILFLLIFGLTGIAVGLALGSWQLRRLAWKQGILSQIETRIAADPVAVPAQPDPQVDRYLSVRASGEIGPGELRVLASVKQVGPGFRLIAPFTLDDGRRVLLDRGFLRETDSAAARPGGPAQVTGNLHWPDEIDGYTPPPDLDAGLWFARDVPAMADALDTEPVLIVARSQTAPRVTPLPVDTAAIPNDHLQYAITWFSLTLIWATMTAYFLWRTRAKAES